MTWTVVWLVVVALARPLHAFSHWIVTEEGKIEHQVASPFNLRQPFNLLAFLRQEERVNTLKELKDELIEYKNEFQDYTTYDSFDFGFRAHDPECRNVQPLSSHDLYISTVLPLEHKAIRLLNHIDLSFRPGPDPKEPFCLAPPLEFSAYAMEHLAGVQERRSLVAPPEMSVLAHLGLRSASVEVFGGMVHRAMEENSTSWVLLNLATLYWRARGNPYHAIECIRRALHYSPLHSMDVALLNLANVLHRSQQSGDAAIVLSVAISLAPDVNVLYYSLGNVYAVLGELNKSIDSFFTSLAMNPQSGWGTVHSVYMSARCELKIEEASKEHSRRLEATQKKLVLFYENMDLIRGSQLPMEVETAYRDRLEHTDHLSKELLEEDLLLDQGQLNESLGKRRTMKNGKLKADGKKKRRKKAKKTSRTESSNETDGSEALKSEASTVSETETQRDSQSVLEEALDHQAVLMKNSSSRDDSKKTSAGDESLSERDGTSVSKENGSDRERKRRSTLRLVLDTSCGCSQTASPAAAETVEQDACANPTAPCAGTDEFSLSSNSIQQCPVKPTPDYTGEHTCSSYSNMTRRRVASDRHSGSASREMFGNLHLSDALDCAISDGSGEECHSLRPKTHVSDPPPARRKAKPDANVDRDIRPEDRGRRLEKLPENRQNRREPQTHRIKTKSRHPQPSLRTPQTVVAPIRKLPEPSPQSEPSVVSPSASYRGMEFLPYNPLPAQLDEAIFPDRSSPLAPYDDPMWPGKGECLEMVATLKSSSPIARFSGTFLTPEARGADMAKLLSPVPLTLPSYMRQKPRCTDIVELPHSMTSLDHLEPVMYRTTLRTSEQAREKGLRKVLIGVVTGDMDMSFSFEESSERAYAAMLKNGPNWALFNIASLFWRVQGDAHNAIECLRRAIHYAPNAAKDVGYIGLANVLHRHGFLNEAVVAARAALDVNGDSPVGHYTLAGIYLSLADYLAASLHLRAALHAQPVFEHALSALKLVRCSLKFTEEQEHLKRRLRQAQEELLIKQEAAMARNLGRALASGRDPQDAVQPAIVIAQEQQPPRFPEELAMGEPPVASSFTGDDAIRYLAKVSLIEQVKKREKEREKEREEEREKEREKEREERREEGREEREERREKEREELSKDENASEPESQSREIGDGAVESDTVRNADVETASEFSEPEVEPPVDSSVAVGDGVSDEITDAPVRNSSSVAESDSDSDVSESESASLSDSNVTGTETVHGAETPSSENYVSDDNDSNKATSNTTSDLFEALADVLLEREKENVIDNGNSGVDETESKSHNESESEDLVIASGSETDVSEDLVMEQYGNSSEAAERNGDTARSDSSPAEWNEAGRPTNSTAVDHNVATDQGNETQQEGNVRTSVPASNEDSGAENGDTDTPVSSQTSTASPGTENTNRGTSRETDPASAVEAAPTDSPLSREGLEEYISSAADLISRNMTPVQLRVPGKIKTREDVRNEEIKKRFPGHRPWPTLDECRKKKVPKTIPFTSTWLAVTAKKIDIRDHVDFDLPLGCAPQLPHCHKHFEDSHRTLSHLTGMHATPLKEYRAEIGLTDVLCKLEGSHRSLGEMATRIKLAMDKNSSSWVLSNLAALYWRIVGEGRSAVRCLRHALYYSSNNTKDVALVSLANVLYRLGFDIDATAVLQMALEVGSEVYDRASPNLVVTHFTMANILAARGYLTEAGGFYESTLHFQPEFQPAAERLWNVRCLTLLGKAAREKKGIGRLSF